MARTITEWATNQLADKLNGLELCEGVSTSWESGGIMRGEVTLGERKGKCFPVYTLEVELPFSGESEGAQVSGMIVLPDVSLEMIDDLEIDVQPGDDAPLPAATETALASGGATAVQTAVREWAAAVRKAVAENPSAIPLDPPTQMQQPRAAALISQEEAMSAAGAAALDDAQADEDLEDVPRDDGAEDREPFTQEEVEKYLSEVRMIIEESFRDEDGYGAQQIAELESELEGKDLQEQGRILEDVLEYLNNPDAEEAGDEGQMYEGEEGEVDYPLYEGEEALHELWKEVSEMCNEEDVPNLQEELKDRSLEEQWKMLHEVRDYLIHGDEEEREAFASWQPSPANLEREWASLLKRVPKEELPDLKGDWGQASDDDKKRLVWDVRKLLEQQDEEMEHNGHAPSQHHGGGDDDVLGKNEVRRRGARRGAEYEYNYEYDFGHGDKDSGDWDENYAKDSKRGRSTCGDTFTHTPTCLA